MTAFLIGALIGSNIVLWSEIFSRQPDKGGYRTGIFEEHPMLGVAIVCFCVVAAAWVDSQ